MKHAQVKARFQPGNNLKKNHNTVNVKDQN